MLAVANMSRRELENLAIGLDAKCHRLYGQRRVYRSQIADMNRALHIRKMENELLRQQLEGVCYVQRAG
jgi:hypothetical protein